MQLEMRGVNYDLDDELKDHIERRLRFALGRFAARIRSVDGPVVRRQRAAWGDRQAVPDRRRPGPPGRGDGRGLGGRPVRPHRRRGEAGGAVRAACAGASSSPDLCLMVRSGYELLSGMAGPLPRPPGPCRFVLK